MRITGSLGRSAAVGVVSTLVDLVTLWSLVHLARLPEAAANVPALLAGLAAQFAGNKWIAFRDRSRDLARQGAQFALVEVGALALNALAFHLLVTWTPIPYLACRILGSAAVYFGWSYPRWAKIFAPRDG